MKNDKKVLSEREINQRMFNVLREAMEQPGDMDHEEGRNKVEASETDVAEAQEKFRQNVAPDANFSEYTILPDEGNVIFSGSIPGLGNWVFEYTQKEGYAFNTDDQITMTDTNFEVLKKMFGYFTNWREEMSDKLLEYKQNND